MWSCSWNSADVNYVYAGLQNGAILVYDTRQVNGEVQRLALNNSRCPIVSLNYVPKAADQALGYVETVFLSIETFWGGIRTYDLLLTSADIPQLVCSRAGPNILKSCSRKYVL